MQKAGYQYINIDEAAGGSSQRDADGSFVIDERAWPALAAGEKPGDMANIVRLIHGLGLKAGIYTDAGKGWMQPLSPTSGGCISKPQRRPL